MDMSADQTQRSRATTYLSYYRIMESHSCPSFCCAGRACMFPSVPHDNHTISEEEAKAHILRATQGGRTEDRWVGREYGQPGFASEYVLRPEYCYGAVVGPKDGG